MIKFINNIGDYFSSNYFDEDFPKKVLSKTGYALDDVKGFQKKISSTKDKYFKYKQLILEGKLRIKDKVTESHKFHTTMLNALGYDSEQTEYKDLFHLDEKTVLPIRHKLYRGEQLHLMIMEMQPLIKESEEEPDGLFEQSYHVEEESSSTPPQKYHRSQWSNIFTVPDGLKISPIVINKAVSQLFLLDAHRRPKYILLCAGNVYYLLEQEKWFKGSYLELNIEMLYDEASIKRDYYSLFYFLLAKETLAPQSEIVLMDQLDEDSHKSAFAVTQDLKEGVIHAVETIANEAVSQLAEKGELLMVDSQWTFTNEEVNVIDIAATLKEECLSYVYRLLFLFYAEAREDLDILPSNDDNYTHGYSLEMLRDLEQVPLNSASSQNGYFFHESLSKLFYLLSHGYREREQVNKSFRIRHLDSPLFDDDNLKILPLVKLRNIVWQDIICQLSLSKKKKGKARGRISYANLGINQLGSVYESLLAFRGFFAESDYIEVHRKKKSAKETSESISNKDGSYLVPRTRLDEFDIKERYYEADDKLRIIKQGTFIYRLSGRDRQKSASYYTPEVLTQCTVKYTLKPILEKLEIGEIKALDLLELKILEPAMGAAAFHNEVINQLAEAYIQYRQKELKKKVAPDKYREETQKVKAYIALNNVYGVDLNPTAIELGKLSLWLNVIHKDMQTPFFGYRLGTGNAVVGAWLKAYDTKDILLNPNNKREKKEWWTKAPTHLKFHKTNHQLLRNKNQIYHFLLPDKAMVASAGIKLLKKEYQAESDHVRSWKSEFIKPISQNELPILEEICEGIDQLLDAHYEQQRKVNHLTKGKLSMFGIDTPELNLQTYDEKERLAAERYRHSAPYFKLKMIMDYWCSLWFWDMREANELPTRQEWYQDMLFIINYKEEISTNNKALITKLSEEAAKTNLYDNNRLKLVKNHSIQYKFFHYQLEFIEVFKERNGFDITVGNPPWIKVNFDIISFYGDYDPKVIVDELNASEVQNIVIEKAKQDDHLFNKLVSEQLEYSSLKSFFNSICNYQYSSGKNNLFKLILENALSLSPKLIGFVIDDGIFGDLKSGRLRAALFKRINYLFRFNNELKLFGEVGNAKKYEILTISDKKEDPNFELISNLFHPQTIDYCFTNFDDFIYGIRDKKDNWELRGNTKRIIKINNEALKSIAKSIDSETTNWKETRIPLLHNISSINILKKCYSVPNRVADVENVHSTQMINETNAQKDGTISKFGSFVDNQDEFIVTGPHFYVATPLNKTPNEGCRNHRDYSRIDLKRIEENYLPRSVFKLNKRVDSHDDYFHIHRRRALNTNERTLIGAILPPNYCHTNNCISIKFPNLIDTISFSAYSYSILYDYLIRVSGCGDIWFRVIENLPLLRQYDFKMIHRALRLNCLTLDYKNLWDQFLPQLEKSDYLCSVRHTIKEWEFDKWNIDTPLRDPLLRRQALLEIDVLVALNFGLTLNELIELYEIQFPVFQKNDSKLMSTLNGNSQMMNRVEDYKVAWKHFEEVLKEEKDG